MSWPRKISLAVLAFVLLPGTARTDTDYSFTPEEYAKYREAAKQLRCQCGCSYTIADCNMLRCSFRERVRPEIRELVAAGVPAELIVERMVEKFGSALKTAPDAEGFGLVGWAMPFVALGIGLVVAPIYVRRWRKREQQAAQEQPPVEVDEAAVDRYEKQIERELEESQ